VLASHYAALTHENPARCFCAGPCAAAGACSLVACLCIGCAISQATARLQGENKDELMSGDEARLADDEGGLAKAGLTNPLLALVAYDGLPPLDLSPLPACAVMPVLEEEVNVGGRVGEREKRLTFIMWRYFRWEK